MTADELIRALVDARLSQDRLQSELAAEMGIPNSQLCEYEVGHHRPRLAMLVTWAEALGYQLVLVPTAVVA